MLWAASSILSQTAQTTPKPPSIDAKAKQTEAEKERKMRREMEIQNLVLTANTQPIEIAADILFGVLDAKLITDQKRRRDIIEDLFRRASEAKEPFKLSFPGGNVDTRTGYRSMGLDQNLDSLSIQIRAVNLMLAIDKKRAREMFRDIPELDLPPLGCEEPVGYEIYQFYRLLLAIVENTFAPEARKRLEHVYFAAGYLDSMNSPAQLGPAIEFLLRVKVSQQEFDILLDSFATRLGKIRLDPRGFYLALMARLSPEIKFIATSKTELKSAQSRSLVKAYRNYLTRHLSAVQCADTLLTGTAEKPSPMIAFANELFESPITEDEIKPEKIEPGVKVFEFWQNKKTKELIKNIKELRFVSTDEPGQWAVRSLGERSKQEWLERLLKFLDQINEWKPEDEETESDYLHQKNVLYGGLVDLAPPGPLRSQVLQNYAIFLRDSRMQKESPIEWLYYVKRLLRLGKALKGRDYDEFGTILTGAGSQVFPLYFDLERLQKTETPRP
jgi:hypothetical protein